MALATEHQAMRDYATTSGCRMAFLRNVLDDNAVGACGRCDNCAGNQYDATTDPRSVGTGPQFHQAAANHHRASQGVGGPVDPGRSVTCSSQAESCAT